MRVLQIISGFAIEGPLGGIERFVVDLVQQLPPTVEPIVCGRWDYHTPADRYWLDFLRAQGITAFCAAPWAETSPYKSLKVAWEGAKRELQGQKIDIIHSHCQFGDPLALMLRRPVGAQALVRTVHNEKEWGRRPFRRWLFSGGVAVAAFQEEIGVSQQVVQTLDTRPVARLLRKKALLCYNALNFNRFANLPDAELLAAYRATLGIPTDARILLSVGRLEPQKGYTYLIEAMAAVVAAHPDTHLVIAGDGGLAAELRQQANASPVAAHIHLVGSQPQIERLYALADRFVSSSLWEGLPTVILESMAAGVAVIATDVSGSRELVKAGESGWLATAGDSAALAAQLVASLRSPDLAGQYAARAKQILTRFDIRTAAQIHADLYQQLTLS
jgi:glycosyltransferase involved in cell wall biosynthesis